MPARSAGPDRNWLGRGERALRVVTRRARVGPVARGAAVKGIDLLSDDDPKRAALQSWLDSDLRLRFAGRLLAIDDAVAERWGQLEAVAKKRRVTLPTIDALLAATALHHGLTLVTRNTADIGPTGVPVVNPWRHPTGS